MPWNRFVAISSIALFIFSGDANAQLFDVDNSQKDFDLFSLSEEFLSRNGVRSMEIHYSRKLPGKPIEDLDQWEEWTFDNKGRHTKRLEISHSKQSIDTVFTAWVYSGDELFALKRNDVLGYYEQRFSNGAENEIIVEQLRNGILINAESRKYIEVNDSTTIEKFINSDGVHYKTRSHYRDRYGRQKRTREQFEFVGNSSEEGYTYGGERGWVQTHYSKKGRSEQQETFEFSELGEILFIHSYQKDELEKSLEFLYEDGFPEAYISKDIKSNHLKIAQFKFMK